MNWGNIAGGVLGGLAGGMFGGGDQTVNTQNVGSYIPSEAEAPMYGWLSQMMQNMMQTPQPYFPGQGYVGPSQPTQQGVNAMMMGAGLMPQFLQQASGNLGFLSNAADVANNPYVQDQLAANEQAVTQALQERWLPGVNEQAMSVGAMGSSRHGIREAQAMERAAQQLANQNASTMLNAYGQGLGAQQFALGQTGNMLQNLLAPGMAQMAAGQAVEDYQQRALNDQMARWNWMYQEPWQRAQNVMGGLGTMRGLGTQYGQGTQPNPAYQSPWQAAVGGTALGYGLASDNPGWASNLWNWIT